MSGTERFCFITEYYDNLSSLHRRFQLFYYPNDESIEMYEIRTKKMFLKRNVVPNVTLKDLYKGNEITIYSRLHKIIDYGDNFTKNHFEEISTNTICLIKPDAYYNIGKIIDYIYQYGFTINKLKLCKFSQNDAFSFYNISQNNQNLINYLTSDYVVGMELIKDNAIKELLNILGPEDATIAKSENPNSLRAIFGESGFKNALHGSLNFENAKKENIILFNKIKHKPILNNCSCVIIKPHIINEGNVGKIIDIILSEGGFEISAMQMMNINKSQAEELFEIYKDVLPEFNEMINGIINGPIIVLEVRQNDCVNKFRSLAGPYDPEVAREVRPNTIRAKFGKNCAFNAIHCTDLEEDAVYECDYLFNKIGEMNN